MNITIKDIANLAGVSKTTVSKIINNKDQSISEATRQKVLNLMKEYNYVPNKLAQSLVTKKTKTIGLIIPDIRNPFFTEIARGAEDKASKEGYNLIFCNTDDKVSKEEIYLDMLVEKMIDGIVFAPSSKSSSEDKKYKNIKVPIVLVDKDINIENVKGTVKVDNLQGTYEATKHLIKNGHKNILYLSGPLENNISIDRLNGYKKALEEDGIIYRQNYILEGYYSTKWGQEIINEIDMGVNYSAICCANDLIAIGAIRSLKENNKRVPEDISVTGFDDINIANIIDPPLTTVKQPAYEIGYKSAQLLIDVLENRCDNIKHKIFAPEFIIRNSTTKKKILSDSSIQGGNE